MTTIGKGVIVIEADSSKFGKDAEKVGREGASRLSKAFSSVTGGIRSTASKAIEAAGTVMKRGAQVAGAGIAGILGTALVKGFGRLRSIDDARAKLTGLGHDADAVKVIMDRALKSVEGTAYGMGDAATIAAQMVAAGIDPAKDLQRVLSLVGDTASIAGTDLTEMGSIWGKVASVGKLQGDSLGQLQERGLPVLQWLAKEYGVTAEAASKMVSAGKVDFETFSRVIEENIGGAARAAGGTFSGALANVGAALGRLGAKVLDSAFQQMPALFAGAISGLDKLGPVAEKVGVFIGAAIERIVKAATGLYDVLVKGDFSKTFREAFDVEEDSRLVKFLFTLRDLAITVFKELTGGITAFSKAWKNNDGEVTSSGFPGVMERLGYWARQTFDYVKTTVIPALGDLVRGFRDGEGPGGVLRSVFDGIWTVAKDLFGFIQNTAIPALGNFIQGFRDGEGPGGVLRDVLEGIWEAAKQAFSYVEDTVIPALSSLYTWFKDNEQVLIVLGTAVLAYKGYMVALELWTKAVTIATTIWTGVQKALNTVLKLNPIGLIIAAIAALIAIVIIAYRENDTFRAIVDKAWAGIKNAIGAVVDWFRNTAWPWLKDTFTKIGNTVMWLWDNIFKPYFTFIWDLLKKVGAWIKDTLWPWMRDAFSNIATKAGDLKDKAVRAFELIKSGISTAWDGAKRILDRFKEGLDSLKTKFGKVKDGIASIWGTITGAIAGPINKVIDTINNFTQNLAEKLSQIPGVSISIPRIPHVSAPPQGGYSGGYQPGRYADGGLIRGPWRGPKADNVLGVDKHGVPTARVNPREMVLSVAGTTKLLRKIGMGGLNMLNRGELPGFAGGGMVGGSLGDTLQDAGSFAWKLLTNPAKALKDLADSMLGGIGSSWAGMIGTGVIKDSMTKLAQWVDKLFGGDDGSAPAGAPGSWRSIVSIVKALWPDAIITSTQRNSTVAGYGGKSLHALGRAADFVLNPWSRMVGATKTLSQMRRWTELIHTPAGIWQQNRGRNTSDFLPITRANHFNHIHAALAKGGLVPFTADAGVMLDKGLNLLNNRTGGPEPLVRADREMRLDAETIRALRGDVKVMIDVDDLRGLRTLEDFLEMIDVRTRQIRGV